MNKQTVLHWALFLCIVLVSCQSSVEVEGTEPRATSTLLETAPPQISLTTASVTQVANSIPTPSETLVPSPVSTTSPLAATNTPVTPSPDLTTNTPSPTSPMGNGLVLYSAKTNQEERIYALQPDGTSQFLIAGRMMHGQALSPNQDQIVIDINNQSQVERSPDNVFIFDLQSQELLNLELLTYPSSGLFWSQDASSLLYIASYIDGTPDQLVLYEIANANNRILAEMEDILVTAGWSVDGQIIAFVAQVDGQYDLFTMDGHTLERKQLTNNLNIETMILWSTNKPLLLVGTALDERSAFEGWPWGVESLYLFDTSNNNWEWLTDKYITSESVSWSPNGNQLVLENAGSLCFLKLETLEETCLLTSEVSNEHFVSFETQPVWSMDGNWIAYRAYNGICTMLYFLDLRTNSVFPGDIGCDALAYSSSSPIYWLSPHLNPGQREN